MDKNHYNNVAALALEDNDAFIELYNKLFPLIHSMIFARIKNVSATDDIVSEIFMKVALNLDSHDKRFAFSTWLFTIARNTLTDYFRRQQRNREDSCSDFFDNSPTISKQPDEKLLSDEAIENLLRAMGKLSARQRKILELKYWSELANVEIAEVMNLSASNVGYLHYQAIKKLRELITV